MTYISILAGPDAVFGRVQILTGTFALRGNYSGPRALHAIKDPRLASLKTRELDGYFQRVMQMINFHLVPSAGVTIDV